jgi:hypothetical protein
MKMTCDIEVSEDFINEVVTDMLSEKVSFDLAFDFVVDDALELYGVKKQVEAEVMKRLKVQKKRVFYAVTQRYETTVPASLMGSELKDYLIKMHKKGNPGEKDSEFLSIGIIDEE